MRKNSVVVINGFTYGGSNLLWNVLQSHPSLVSVMKETGEYLFPRPWNKIQGPLRSILLSLDSLGANRIEAIGRHISENLDSKDHQEKAPGVLYSKEEIQNAVPVYKSLNEDVFLNPLFHKAFDEVFTIAIVRNGYALCESWKRRGRTTAEAIDHYHRIGRYFMEQEQKDPRFKVVRMEDILIDPFAVSVDLNKFLGLDPQELDHLRLKSKKLVGKDGSHEVRFGKQNSKYWFDKTSIEQFIDKGINEKQLKQLTDNDRATFESQAGDILAHFGYS